VSSNEHDTLQYKYGRNCKKFMIREQKCTRFIVFVTKHGANNLLLQQKNMIGMG
jgi:hypothetical protein